MANNALILHGGAPTAVINASLYGAVLELSAGKVDKILGARGGTGGVLREDFIDLQALSEKALRGLPFTPASAIGTSRDHLEQEDYEKIASILKKHDIRYLLVNGGNGSMDTCGKIVAAAGSDVRVVGIPKTIDNDIAVTDHAPGFGSAARYLAGTVAEVVADVRSLPIHVAVVEAMGRNAGWLCAAAALAADTGFGPDLIYCPEHPFSEEAFLSDVERLHKAQGGVVVVASEGLKKTDGTPIVEPIFSVGRSVYYGDVGAHLGNLVIQRLGIKARSEKPGICGRASMMFQSSVDREEAILCGREAAKAVLSGKSGVMVGLRRLESTPYAVEPVLIPVEEVMLHERTLPLSFLNEEKNGVSPSYLDWCRPLIGGPLPEFVKL